MRILSYLIHNTKELKIMPKCKACDDEFVWNDDVVIVNDEHYIKRKGVNDLYGEHKDEKADKKELFLKELGELSKKYGLYIGGCGCCGSPFVIRVHEGVKEVVAENLEWDFEKERYINFLEEMHKIVYGRFED